MPYTQEEWTAEGKRLIDTHMKFDRALDRAWFQLNKRGRFMAKLRKTELYAFLSWCVKDARAKI